MGGLRIIRPLSPSDSSPNLGEQFNWGLVIGNYLYRNCNLTYIYRICFVYLSYIYRLCLQIICKKWRYIYGMCKKKRRIGQFADKIGSDDGGWFIYLLWGKAEIRVACSVQEKSLICWDVWMISLCSRVHATSYRSETHHPLFTLGNRSHLFVNLYFFRIFAPKLNSTT